MADPISIGLMAASLGLNIFGAQQDKDNADAIITAQHNQAVRNTNWQNSERETLFNQQVDAQRVAAQNNENELKFREDTELALWDYQMDQRSADYNAQLAAYEASADDFDIQMGIIADAEDLALKQTQQKYNDQETALGFQREEELINQLGQYNAMITRLDQGQSAVDDALMEETLMETAALRDRDQSYDKANYGLDMIREQAGEAQTRTDLENARLQEQVNAQRTATHEQLMLLDQAKQTDELDTDNLIYRNQLQTRQRIAQESLKLGQDTANLEGDLSDATLATEQLLERLGIKNEGDNLTSAQREELLEDEFGTTSLRSRQQVAQLVDAQRYNRLERDTTVSNLNTAKESTKAKLEAQLGQLTEEQRYNLLNRESNVGELGFQLRQTQLEYQQNRAAQSFKQEANRIEQLVNSGQIRAQGRKGASAARSINNILAAAGRQSAQLTDSILRGEAAFQSRKSEIGRQKNLAEKRFGIQSGSIRRKKGEARTEARIDLQNVKSRKDFADRKLGLERESTEQRIKDAKALLGRSEISKDLKIEQSKAQQDITTKMFEAEKAQATDTLTQREGTTERRVGQVSDTAELAIGQIQQSSTQAIGDLNESEALRKDQSYQKAVYINDKFTNSFNALTAEQNLLAENLQQQLNAFSRETGTLNQQKEFARENYNVAYQRAQEVHDSALRRYGDTEADVERERERQAQQDALIEDQYEASLESAEQARLASVSSIAQDRYSAEVTADKAVMPEPVEAPEIPKPYVYPRTQYPDLLPPVDLPEPEKGVSAGVNYAGAVGNFAGQLAQINW
tara:strand:+ start:2687 stop:5092 length:2406 start_codon:yes stop_codon:yes gene_type:complete